MGVISGTRFGDIMENEKLPKEFVDEYLEKAKGFTIFGISLNELSREELIACTVAGWEAERKQIKESTRQRKFLLDLNRAKSLARPDIG